MSPPTRVANSPCYLWLGFWEAGFVPVKGLPYAKAVSALCHELNSIGQDREGGLHSTFKP